MTNQDFIREFIKGTRTANAYCHLCYREDTLWNYSTVICKIDRTNKTAELNVRKYSRTTSTIQTYMRRALQNADYTITEYEGNPAVMWNFGYQGAETWKVNDVNFKEN